MTEHEAAAEIARLRAENERLAVLLKDAAVTLSEAGYDIRAAKIRKALSAGKQDAHADLPTAADVRGILRE